MASSAGRSGANPPRRYDDLGRTCRRHAGPHWTRAAERLVALGRLAAVLGLPGAFADREECFQQQTLRCGNDLNGLGWRQANPSFSRAGLRCPGAAAFAQLP
ncbi:MAG: hypothetical protein WBC76_08650 [Actinomycetes bacterium]